MCWRLRTCLALLNRGADAAASARPKEKALVAERIEYLNAAQVGEIGNHGNRFSISHTNKVFCMRDRMLPALKLALRLEREKGGGNDGHGRILDIKDAYGSNLLHVAIS